MDADGFDETAKKNPEIELIMLKLRHAEEKTIEKVHELDIVRATLNQERRELKRKEEELNNLYRQFDVMQEKLKRAEEILSQGDKVTAKKNTTSKLLAFLANLLFLLATILASFGTNMLTSASPNPTGVMMIFLALITFTVGAIMTTIISSKEGIS